MVLEPAAWVRVAVPVAPVEAVAVIVMFELTVRELLITALYVPSLLLIVCPGVSPGSLELKLTLSALTALPLASETVAVALVVESPLATIDVG